MSSSIDLDQQREWIRAIQAGRLDVFQTVFEHYAAHLQRFAQLWVARDAAEDIVQEVFFDLWQRRSALNPEQGRLTSYLFSAVRNHIAKIRRHDAVVYHARQEMPEATHGVGSGIGATDAPVLREDLRTMLLRGMGTLSELQRAVLMLRWVQHMPFVQIAETLSISENAAKLHASRGRQALYAVLKPAFDP